MVWYCACVMNSVALTRVIDCDIDVAMYQE